MLNKGNPCTTSVDILPHPECLLECTRVGHTQLLLLYIMKLAMIVFLSEQHRMHLKEVIFLRATISIRHIIRSI